MLEQFNTNDCQFMLTILRKSANLFSDPNTNSTIV